MFISRDELLLVFFKEERYHFQALKGSKRESEIPIILSLGCWAIWNFRVWSICKI